MVRDLHPVEGSLDALTMIAISRELSGLFWEGEFIMNKRLSFHALRTSAFLVAALAVCAIASNKAQAQVYSGSVGVDVGYGGGVQVSVNSYQPGYGYYYNRPYYVAPSYGYEYRPVVLPVVRTAVVRPVVRTVVRPVVRTVARPFVYGPPVVRYRW